MELNSTYELLKSICHLSVLNSHPNTSENSESGDCEDDIDLLMADAPICDPLSFASKDALFIPDFHRAFSVSLTPMMNPIHLKEKLYFTEVVYQSTKKSYASLICFTDIGFILLVIENSSHRWMENVFKILNDYIEDGICEVVNALYKYREVQIGIFKSGMLVPYRRFYELDTK
ncbi:unnamed protein product [Blepharisma stoltei]|uniref:Uncharacterized protein n=1 Tax=Blepharisma stoltei TaxID=1481888 RepID=A0AAU9J159_9CILI|nr:unnamed protein product [Blepharisma stoltei]